MTFECQQALGRHEEAARAIAAAIEADPSNPVYPNSSGLLLRYLGRHDEAVAQFRASLRIQQGHEWPCENLGATLLVLGRWDEFFPHMAYALGFAIDRVTAADEAARSPDPEAGAADLAALQEALEYQRFHAASLRHLYIEGLRLQRAEAK